MRQIEQGEFGDHHGDFAKLVTAQDFAGHFGVNVHTGTTMLRVNVGGIDYYWSKRTGKYDGSGRSMA